MPLLIFAGGLVTGLWLRSEFASDASSLVKWGAIAGGVFLAGKIARVW